MPFETADVLKEGFRRKGYRFYLDSPTNQIFVILENSRMEALSRQAAFCFWEEAGCIAHSGAVCHQLGYPPERKLEALREILAKEA